MHVPTIGCPVCKARMPVLLALNRATAAAPVRPRLRTTCPRCGALVRLEVFDDHAEAGEVLARPWPTWTPTEETDVPGLRVWRAGGRLHCRYHGVHFEYPVRS